VAAAEADGADDFALEVDGEAAAEDDEARGVGDAVRSGGSFLMKSNQAWVGMPKEAAV
jgi:hypothetical protein